MSDPAVAKTSVPESGYGKQLRQQGLLDIADKMDQLIHRERLCDAHCGCRDAEIDRLRAVLRSIAGNCIDMQEAVQAAQEALHHAE